MKHRLQYLLTFAFAGISLAGEPLGKLGTIELTADDFRDSILSLNEAQIASLRADPALLEQIARTSLVQKLVLQEATDKKWQEQPKIAARVRRAHDSAITESYLESIAEPARDYPSDDEVKAAYQTVRESLKVPRSFRLAQIYIADDPKKLAGVEELLAAKDADFARIASEHSQEPASASRGGEIGWLTETQIEKDLLPPIAELKLNEVSKPVKLKDGWHILKLLDARAPHTPTLEQARPQLVKQLRQDKLRANSQAYLAALLRKHPLQINASALTEALPGEPSANARP
jgi:peptidylprolyl isomerase